MVYDNRIEGTNVPTFQTTRTRNSALWFINNPRLSYAILGILAKVKQRYGAKVYAFAIEGNHVQFPALFQNGNKASFMRDLNSGIANAVQRHVPTYTGSTLWGRRYSAEYLFGDETVEQQFFYTVLQPVQDGLVEKISDYPGYNCFHDAAYGIVKKIKVVDWAKYNEAKRYRKRVSLREFTTVYELKYDRLPGKEHLTHAEYVKYMHEKLEEYRQKVLAFREEHGIRGFMGTKAIRSLEPGVRPKKTKTSTRNDKRPRVMSPMWEHYKIGRLWQRSFRVAYVDSSRRYRAGDLTVEFPPGTYRPPTFTRPYRLELELMM